MLPSPNELPLSVISLLNDENDPQASFGIVAGDNMSLTLDDDVDGESEGDDDSDAGGEVREVVGLSG